MMAMIGLPVMIICAGAALLATTDVGRRRGVTASHRRSRPGADHHVPRRGRADGGRTVDQPGHAPGCVARSRPRSGPTVDPRSAPAADRRSGGSVGDEDARRVVRFVPELPSPGDRSRRAGFIGSGRPGRGSAARGPRTDPGHRDRSCLRAAARRLAPGRPGRPRGAGLGPRNGARLAGGPGARQGPRSLRRRLDRPAATGHLRLGRRDDHGCGTGCSGASLPWWPGCGAEGATL
jgi:hypothetical protein